jgi:iron(III) transport system permease protein
MNLPSANSMQTMTATRSNQSRRFALSGKHYSWLIAAPIALLTIIPLLVLISSIFNPQTEIWTHLAEYVLPQLLLNTFWLVIGVAVGVTVLGVSLAWLTAVCEFPGWKIFRWALLLPMALPAYVMAFVWLGLFDITGIVPLWCRDVFGWQWTVPVRSRGGVIWVMVLAFYPYVYLTARSAFQNQGRRLIEAAQSLGISPAKAFWRVALPLAKPGIMAGLLLAIMETLADFGTVAIFNYDTFTTAIYQSWFSLYSLPAASQLAALLIVFVLFVALLESQFRSNKNLAESARSPTKANRIVLRGASAWLASIWCGLIFVLAFVVPMVPIVWWAFDAVSQDLDARYWAFAGHSLLLASLGTCLIITLAILLAYAQRMQPTFAMRLLSRVATLGYALPGTVLAVGVFIPVAYLDNVWIDLNQWLWHREASQIFQGSVLVMLLGYCARFLAVSYAPIETGLQQISRSMDEAAQSLGVAGIRRLRLVHIPMLRASLLAGAALCFVDIMKELPITLMTRPFAWDTLAVRVFEMTSEGEWQRAALPALLIVLVGLLPVIFLNRRES